MEGAGAGDPWGLSGEPDKDGGGLGCAQKKQGVSNKTLIYCEVGKKSRLPKHYETQKPLFELRVCIVMPELADWS